MLQNKLHVFVARFIVPLERVLLPVSGRDSSLLHGCPPPLPPTAPQSSMKTKEMENHSWLNHFNLNLILTCIIHTALVCYAPIES